MEANQVFIESETTNNNISGLFPSQEPHDLTFLTATLIAKSSIVFAMLLVRSTRYQMGSTKKIGVSNK